VNIEQVVQIHERKNIVYLSFVINDYPYRVKFVCENDAHYYEGVFHRSDQACPLCGYEFIYCPVLDKQKKKLINQLIEQKPIRLYWLFQHVVYVDEPYQI